MFGLQLHQCLLQANCVADRFRATAVFHGHAHNGILDSKTSTGIPVYNVSAPALRKSGKPYRIVEL